MLEFWAHHITGEVFAVEIHPDGRVIDAAGPLDRIERVIIACRNDFEGDPELTEDIEATHDNYKGLYLSAGEQADLADLWDSLSTHISFVLDERGTNVANAKLRWLEGDYWLYVDDVDGYSVIDDTFADILMQWSNNGPWSD